MSKVKSTEHADAINAALANKDVISELQFRDGNPHLTNLAIRTQVTTASPDPHKIIAVFFDYETPNHDPVPDRDLIVTVQFMGGVPTVTHIHPA